LPHRKGANTLLRERCVFAVKMVSFWRDLPDLGDRSEHGGRARTGFTDVEAHSGAMERKTGELWAALPPAQ
jgi:hypothetical protein